MDQLLQSQSVDEWIDQLAADAYWGTRMDQAARQTIRAMQYSTQPHTLDDLFRAFDDSEYREQIEGGSLSDDQGSFPALASRAKTFLET